MIDSQRSPMTRQLQHIDDGIFTISHLFSPDECLALIARAESIGFAAASVRTPRGPQMMTHIRNNDRVVLHDAALAERMWSRAQPLLPVLDHCVPCGVDSQLRFYRYCPGQHFKRHKDGAVTNEAGQTSKLSYLIYLNDDCDGGSTTFRDHRDVNGTYETVELIIRPTTGTALLFRHERWHEGAPVTRGLKYILRTDVFYTPQRP
jgi:predicted 2-oxoglutarate/Fe(II)-dependent dioxygenase YbiX